jgi:hypothetical protein
MSFDEFERELVFPLGRAGKRGGEVAGAPSQVRESPSLRGTDFWEIRAAAAGEAGPLW